MEELYELPDGWVWCKLGEVCEINPKSTNLSDFDQSLPTTFVPMTAVDQIEGAIKTPEIQPLGKARKGHTQFIENDVIFARITPCMENGKAALAKNLKNCLGFGSTEFHVIRPPYEIIPEYIFYFIRQESFRNKASAHFTSTVGQMRVPKAFMLAASFPLPPLSEQHRIVIKLEALLAQVDRSKDHLAKVLPLIKRFRQSVLAAACSGRLTEDWRREHPDVEPALELLNRIREERVRRYDEECRKAKKEGRKKQKKDYEFIITENLSISSWVDAKLENLIYIAGRIGWRGLKAEEYTKEGPLFLSVHDLNYGEEVDFRESNHLSMERYDESPEIKLQENDILLAKDGAGIGKIGIVKNLNCNFNHFE